MAPDTLLAYARSLTYDPMAGDSQRLMLGRYPNGRYGPRVKIEPVVGSHLYDTTELKQGRVMARLINVDTIPYPKLNLAGLDTVYWWIYAPNPPGASLLYSTRQRFGLDAGLVRHRENVKAPMALARWFWTDDDETTWVFCVQWECCRIQ